MSIIVKVETSDGLVGWGETAPTAVITGDTAPSIIGAVNEVIKPTLLGLDLDEFDNALQKLHTCLVHNTSAIAAVDIALYDLRAQSARMPMYKLLGGAKQYIYTDITISLNSLEQMVTDSIAAVQAGFSILKIKTGKDWRQDVSAIKKIRAAVGDDVKLLVDANQGYTPKDAVRAIRQMESEGVTLVEQPVNARDLDGLRFVTQNVVVPILADEAVFSTADAIKVITTGAADMLNIKLMKTGGISEALRIISVAEAYGVQCMMGCMMEGKISVAAAAHLACAKNVITMADLDGPSLYANDPYTGGPSFGGQLISMTKSNGIGTIFQHAR
jgi:L-alanine-DL-glutamate epimerase-like enolase superfamily enzyme